MTGKRSYDDGCGVAHALETVGERWAILIVRDLILGPKRFTDLQAGLPGAGANVLSTRLRELCAAGVVRQHVLPPPSGARVYELTEWGRELDPILSALGRWGAVDPLGRQNGPTRADSLVISLRNLFTTGDESWDAVVEIRLGRDVFTAQVTAGSLVELTRGRLPARPDATVETDLHVFESLLFTGRADGTGNQARPTITGDAAAVEKLFQAARRGTPETLATLPG